MSGVFAVFLSDSINRVIITGMILPGIVLASHVDRIDTVRRTHVPTQLWVRSRSVRFATSAVIGTATYGAGIRLIVAYVWPAVSGRTQINTVVTHGCENFEEKKEKMTSREN